MRRFLPKQFRKPMNSLTCVASLGSAKASRTVLSLQDYFWVWASLLKRECHTRFEILVTLYLSPLDQSSRELRRLSHEFGHWRRLCRRTSLRHPFAESAAMECPRTGGALIRNIAEVCRKTWLSPWMSPLTQLGHSDTSFQALTGGRKLAALV
jgi:hypothetical protein